MSETFSSERARELFKAARESDELTEWQSELRMLAGLARDKAILSMVNNPDISLEEKSGKLAERLGKSRTGVVKLLSELIGSGRFEEIDEISYRYQRLLDEHHGIKGTETVEIITAVTLDDTYLLDIGKKLTGIIGKPVTVKTIVDPELIGGIIIKIGDKVIDGSIRSRLASLKREISRAV
ncbi:MAG: ATP synthase F1 subunit delta [Dehalococcoidales bacterium]|nr:ATP synthase F1 subunit delta [Dehalococcoidales bacterium]